jgi:hypothetical protein
MGNKAGWLPGSYRAVERTTHFRGGVSARGAFDGGYDNGPRPRRYRALGQKPRQPPRQNNRQLRKRQPNQGGCGT